MTTSLQAQLGVLMRMESTDPRHLFSHFNSMFECADLDFDVGDGAVVWQSGYFDGHIEPIPIALTDEMALLGTFLVMRLTDLPAYPVPLMAQYRHDMKKAPLHWLAKFPGEIMKPSTAGDKKVLDEKGELVTIDGKSGNGTFRTAAGVYCTVRRLNVTSRKGIVVVRAMPMPPYSDDKKNWNVDENCHLHMSSKIDLKRMAYAARTYLEFVAEQSRKTNRSVIARTGLKPTQSVPDAFLAGLMLRIAKSTRVEIVKVFGADPYEEYQDEIELVMAQLPADFLDGLSEWRGRITCDLADLCFGQAQHDALTLVGDDVIARTDYPGDVVYLDSDVAGDYQTDQVSDTPGVMIRLIKMVVKQLELEGDADEAALKIWHDLGFEAADGYGMTSVMHRREGRPIYEMVLGTAGDKVRAILDGKEGYNKEGHWDGRFYNPRALFALMVDAYTAANPGDDRLRRYFEHVMGVFNDVYSDRGCPKFFEGVGLLEERIKPWPQWLRGDMVR